VARRGVPEQDRPDRDVPGSAGALSAPRRSAGPGRPFRGDLAHGGARRELLRRRVARRRGNQRMSDQMPIPQAAMEDLPLTAQVEAVLFVADRPVRVAELSKLLLVPPDALEDALAALADAYRGRGLTLQRHGDALQL